MDFLSNLLSSNKPNKEGGQQEDNPAPEQPPPAVSSPAAPPPQEEDVDESLPPTIEYPDFGSSPSSSSELTSLWGTFEETYADMTQSLETKMEAFSPFAEAFVAAYEEMSPEMWRIGEGGGGGAAAAAGHPKLVVIFVCTFLQDILTEKTPTHTQAAAVDENNASSFYRQYEEEILGGDMHDFTACLQTLLHLASSSATTSADNNAEETRRRKRRRRKGLLSLLTVLAQLVKYRHNRRFLLHSMGHGFAHFLVSFLLALCRVVEGTWNERQEGRRRRRGQGGGIGSEGEQAEDDEDDAVVFLLSSLLYTLQLFHHAVPSYPHYCLLAEKQHTFAHPWSRARIAHICHNAGIGSSSNKQVEKQVASRVEEEQLERSIRSLSFHETWSLVSIQEGVLPSLLQVLHLSMTLLSSLSSTTQTHTDTDKATISSSSSSSFLLGSMSSSSTTSIDLRRFLLLLQSETLLGIGAFVACHPHEALPALTKSGRKKEVLVSVLTSFLGLEGVSESVCVKEEGTANMLLSLAWQRSDLTLELLKECVPIVAALHHVKGLLENNALRAQGKKQGGGGFLSSALLAVRGGGSGGGGGSTSAYEDANSNLSLLTMQDISGILSEGLVQGLAQMERLPFATQDSGSGNKKPTKVMITCPPSAAALPVPYQHYDLWPWKQEEEEEQQQQGEKKEEGGGGGPDDDRQPSPQLQRQGSRRNLLLQRSLSSSALSLPEVFELAAPFLRDPHITYRLMMEGPLLSQEEEEEEEESRKEGGNRASLPPSREDMYASIFTHLEALCHMVPEATMPRTPGLLPSAVGRSGSGGGATTQQQVEVPSMQTVALEILQHVLSTTSGSIDTKRQQRSPLLQRHVILFVNARLLQSPLETIAACRHLKLWPLLLASVGLSVSSPLPFPFVQEEEEGEGAAADSRYPITNSDDKTAAAAWFHIQDLCLELLHRVFVAAQRPPTTNFLSSPTLEMGLVVSLLEEVVVKQERENKRTTADVEGDAEAKAAEDLLIFQACRWLNMMIREHDSAPTVSASSSSRSSTSVVPAFNEHGVRLLTLLPRLLLASLPSSSSYLRWPALHALLSLMASTIHIASVIESKLALEPWVNQVLHIHTHTHITFSALWEFMALELCQGVVVFILTRFLHILAQLSVVVIGGGGSGASGGAAVVLVEPGAVAAFYKECLAQVERWHVTSSEEEGGQEGEDTEDEAPPQQHHTHTGRTALFSMLQGLCRFLRETQFSPPVLRFHQRALRQAGVFPLVGQVLEAHAAAQASAPTTQTHTCGPSARELLCQGLAFLTALMAENELNRQAFVASLLSHQVPGESMSQSRLLRLLLQVAALDSFETVHVLVDLLVAGPFRLPLDDNAHGVDAALSPSPFSDLIIKVPGLVHLLFLLVPHLAPTLQVDIFRLLQVMMSGMHGERNADIRPLLVDRLLALIPSLSQAHAGEGGKGGPQEVAIDLLAVVGAYFMSVPQLRRVMDLLHAQPQPQTQTPCCQPIYAPMLLSALDKMVHEKGGEEEKESRRRRLLPSSYSPSHYFLFDGNSKHQQHHHHYHQAAGLRLRPLAPWTKKHYSFFTWVRLQENVPASQQQHLFSFVAEDGTALEAYLVPITTSSSGGDVYILQMESRRNKATPQYIQWTVMEETSSSLSLSSSAAAAATESVPKITAGAWTFIGISHRAPTGFRSASDVLVVVNGVTFRGTLPYPGMRVLSSRSYIGGSASASGSSGLKGKMTAVYLLDEGLKEEHLRGIYTRGPDFDLAGGLGDGVLEGALLSSRIMLLLHPGRFHNPSESGSPPSSSSSLFFNQEEEERGETTAAFFRTVQDWRRRAVLETLRVGGSTAEYGQAVVKLCQGTYACAGMDVRKAFEALGGVKVLFPVLAQVGLPDTAGAADTHTHINNTSALHVIDLLGKLLAQAPLGSSDFFFLFGDENDEEGSGCALLLSHLLERLPSSCLTLELVAALQSFITRIGAAWRNPLVTATFVAHLFGNFKIWHRTPSSSVQEEVLQLLLYHLQSASSVSLYLSQLLRVEEMVAALQLFYPYQQQQGKSSSSLPRYDSSSPSVKETKEGEEAERESGKPHVRRWILEIIYKIMRATATGGGGGGGGGGEGQEVMMVAVPGEDDKEGANGAGVDGLEKQREDNVLCIFNLLAAVEDERGACELLHLILRLLSPELVQIILAVPSSSPVYLLLRLVGASSPFASSLAVRLLAFSVLAKLFLFGHRMDQEKKRLAAAAAAAAGGGTGKRPISFGSLFSTPSSPLSTMRGQRSSGSLSTSAKQRLSGSVAGTSSLSLTSGGGGGGGGGGERLSASMRMSANKEGGEGEKGEDGETQLLNPEMDFVWEEGRVVEFLFWMTRAFQEGHVQTHTQQASALVVETLWSIATASTSSAVVPLEKKKERVALLADATGLLPVWFEGLLATASSKGGNGEEDDTSKGKEREEEACTITFSAPLPALRFLIQNGVADASYRRKLALALPGEEEEEQAKTTLAIVEKLKEKMDKAQATALPAMATLVRYRQQEGVEHLTRVLASYEDERVWVWQRRWLVVLDEVANERAPWGPFRAWLSHIFAAGGVKEMDKEDPVSWTLDDVEDHLRHRCKLVRRMPHRDSVVLGVGEEEGKVAFLRHALASSKMRGKDEVIVAAAAVSASPEQQQQEEEEEEDGEGDEQDGSVGLQLSTSIASLTLAQQQQERDDLEDMTQTSLWKELAKYQRAGKGGEEEEEGMEEVEEEDEEEEEEEDEEEEGDQAEAAVQEENGKTPHPQASTPSRPAAGEDTESINSSTTATSSNYSQPRPPPPALSIPSPPRRIAPLRSQSSWQSMGCSGDKEELVVITTTTTTPKTPFVYLNRAAAAAVGRGRRSSSSASTSGSSALITRQGARSSVPLVDGGGGAPTQPTATTGVGGGRRKVFLRGGTSMGSSTRIGPALTVGSLKESRPCEVIQPFVTSPGLFEVCKRALRFTFQEQQYHELQQKQQDQGQAPPSGSTSWCLQPFPSTLFFLHDIHALYLRLYQQQLVALEFFFLDQSSLFLNFHSKAAALAIYKAIRKLRPRHLEPHLGHHPRQIIGKMKTAQGHTLTQAWIHRELSNFDYLSYLNLVAGRTWHDLAQYPVFPWILADYSSTELDLGRSETFRDLRWPMGAQRPSARQALRGTYQMLEEEFRRQQMEVAGWDVEEMGGPPPAPMPPFHHGSHYSTAAFVLWYLLRLEPFTSLHIHLQSGKFDHPDRQFRSLQAAYEGCVANPSDVKELIPEFFFLPDFLVNVNKFDLGVTQRGQEVGDVELPPWAKGSVDEFVRLHREALESEYVSENLHHWIDLIFGYKQRPPFLTSGGGSGGGRPASSSSSSASTALGGLVSGARKGSASEAAAVGGSTAVESFNVFFNLTYHEALDMEALQKNDALLYESTLKQIQDFGQTPMQLFTTPHPARTLLHNATEIIWPIASVVQGAGTVLPPPRSAGPGGDEGEGEGGGGGGGGLGISLSAASSATSSSLSASSTTLLAAPGGGTTTSYSLPKPERLLSFPPHKLSQTPILAIAETAGCDRLFTLDGAWHVSTHGWSVLSPDVLPPFKLKPDLSGSGSGRRKGRGGGGGQEEVVMDVELGLLFTCGYLDNSFKVAVLEDLASSSSSSSSFLLGGGEEDSSSGGGGEHGPPPQHQEVVQSIAYQHKGIVRCLALGKNGDVRHHSHHATVTTTSSASASASRGGGGGGGSGGGGGTGGGGGSGGGGSAGGGGNSSSGSRVYLVTGSEDCTVCVWEVLAVPGSAGSGVGSTESGGGRAGRGGGGGSGTRWVPPVHPQPLHVLRGHADVVISVAVHVELDLVVSGSRDGTFLVHSLREGQYIRTLSRGGKGGSGGRCQLPPLLTLMTSSASVAAAAAAAAEGRRSENERMEEKRTTQTLAAADDALHWVGISSAGYLLSYSRSTCLLTSHSINGRLRARLHVETPLHAFCFSEDGHILLVGGEDQKVTMLWCHNLRVANDGPREGLEALSCTDGSCESLGLNVPAFPAAIRSLTLTAHERHLLVGLENGELYVLAPDANYLRQRLKKKLESLGFY